MESIKCVIVGDCVGKTSMLIKYTTNDFPNESIPTIFDQYTANLCVDGKPVTLQLWDSSGLESYDCLRPTMYPRTDVCIICFSLTEPSHSFENVLEKWCPEVMRHIPKVPIILVGTKLDLRDAQFPPNKIEESLIKGRELAMRINAARYMECSALTNIGLAEVFQSCVRVVRHPPRRSKKNPEGLLPNYLLRFTSCCTLM
ncbi:Rho-related protein rac1A [Orchesella cincta]|uniref:Rho-related protein rac1A n=1 Tax=Orchesella cincta TaxID=48709 RepID=A0A1D2MX87_ORCCI|nr:Rho-related protein rac1A [Orchesella cincta]